MRLVEHAFDDVVRAEQARAHALDRMRHVHLMAFTPTARISWREQWCRVHKARVAFTEASDAYAAATLRMARWSRTMHRVRGGRDELVAWHRGEVRA